MSTYTPWQKYTNDESGWILTAASSLSCFLGSLLICLDVVWRWLRPRSKFILKQDQRFLIASLSLSGGVLMFTSMYRLLPQALTYFQGSPQLGDNLRAANFLLISSYALGILICAGLNAVIHIMTSESIVHCAHDEHGASGHHHFNQNFGHSHDSHYEDEHIHDHIHDHTHDHIHDQSDHSNTPTYDHTNHNHSNHEHDHNDIVSSLFSDNYTDHNHGDQDPHTHLSSNPLQPSQDPATTTTTTVSATEQTPLLYTDLLHMKEVNRRESLLDLSSRALRGKKCIGICMGYKEIDSCCAEYFNAQLYAERHNLTLLDNDFATSLNLRSRPVSIRSGDLETQINHENHLGDHHHHVSSKYSHLFSIGLQTALAISLHKVPEGFLTFATTHADRELGFNVFVALAIHNFSEGFTIAFPLYLALGNRYLALLCSFVLGSLSQPIGAGLAWWLFKDREIDTSSNLIFGLIVGITAGFLSIIGLQMYGTAITFGGSQRVTLSFAFSGIFIIGIAYSIV